MQACTHTPPTHASYTHFSSVPLCAPCLAHGVGWRPWSRSASSDTRRTSASCCSSKTAIATGRGGKDGVSGLDLRRLHRGFAISTSVILLGLASWSSDRECGLDLWVWIRGGEALALYKSKLGSCAGAAPESGHHRADTNNGSGLDPHFMRSLAAVQKAVRSMLFSHVHFGFQQDLVLRSPRIRVHHRSSSAFITRASASSSPSAGNTASQPSTSAPTRPATHVRAHRTTSAGCVHKSRETGVGSLTPPPSPCCDEEGMYRCHADSMPLRLGFQQAFPLLVVIPQTSPWCTQGYGSAPPPQPGEHPEWWTQALPPSSPLPAKRQIYCNRALNMKQIKARGAVEEGGVKEYRVKGRRGKGGRRRDLHQHYHPSKAPFPLLPPAAPFFRYPPGSTLPLPSPQPHPLPPPSSHGSPLHAGHWLRHGLHPGSVPGGDV